MAADAQLQASHLAASSAAIPGTVFETVLPDPPLSPARRANSCLNELGVLSPEYKADYSAVRVPAIDETSSARGHDYVTIAADARRRAVIFVTETRETAAIERLAADLTAYGSDPGAVRAVSIDILSAARRADLDALLMNLKTKRTARVWEYREGLREILSRKQINVVRDMLWQWCTNVMRPKVQPMKNVARMIRNHFDGVIAWALIRMANGFLEALNGLSQPAKRNA